MAIIKCKMCGGDMELSADKTMGMCEFCGSTMTLPKIDDNQRAAAFNRGNHFRRIGEFDKALAVYERIVREDETDAEAHWCCALCRFGIEYVEDPTTYEWLPTCHRASFDPFLEDVDYKAALEHSDGVTRRQYMKDGAKIADVQRGILATSQNTEPYDVFICYKETDENGERTRDSLMAQDIYYQLTEQGRKVFFARITLEDVAGTQYEPYIFAALNSAKVMIVVGTKPEYLNAVWVKNEWSRFLSMMKKDRSKLLLPCYRDMDPYDLPEQLSVLQSYDMSKIGFLQDLTRGISKVFHKSSSASTPVAVQSNFDSAVIMAFMDYELEKKDSALATFRQVLMQNSTCAEAYLGMVMCTQNTEECDSYRNKFRQYASERMSLLERAVFTPRIQRDILLQYCEIKDHMRVLDALEIYVGKVDNQLFFDAVTRCTKAEIVNAFCERNCNTNIIMQDQTHKETLLSYLLYRYDATYDVVLALLNHGADANCYRWSKDEYHVPLIADCMDLDNGLEMIQLLLEHGADANGIVKKYDANSVYSEESVLNIAVSSGNLPLVKLLLSHGANVNNNYLLRTQKGDNYFSTLMIGVIKNENTDIIEILLEHGADVHYISQEHGDGEYRENSAIVAAVNLAKYEIIQLLLRYGADVNSFRTFRNQYGESCFTILDDSITVSKNSAIVKLLLDNGADVSCISKYYAKNGSYHERSPIHAAREANSEEIMRLLLSNGASADSTRLCRNQYGDHYFSVLYDCIAIAKSSNMVKILLEHGADVSGASKFYDDKGSYHERTLINAAVIAKEENLVRLLLEHGADPNSERLHRDEFGDSYYSVLYDSILYSTNQMLTEQLLSCGANPLCITKYNDNRGRYEIPLIISAVRHKRIDIVDVLLKYGANVNSVGIYRNERGIAYHNALESSLQIKDELMAFEMAEFLLKRGANISSGYKVCWNDGTYDDNSLIATAAKKNSIKLVQLLITYGADINSESIIDGKRYNVLAFCILFSDEKMVKFLLENGANASYIIKPRADNEDDDFMPMLFYVIVKNDINKLQLLLEHGANPNECRIKRSKESNNKISSLSYCTGKDYNIDVAKLLLKYGADPRSVDVRSSSSESETVQCMLYRAAKIAKSSELVKLLLEYGATVKDPVTYQGKVIPLKRYPLELPEDIMVLLRNAGWKGPGLFSKK